MCPGLSVSKAGIIAASIAIVGGITGSLFGGFVAPRMERCMPLPHLIISAVGVFAAAAISLASFWVFQDNLTAVYALFVASSFWSWVSNGPIMAVVVGSAPANMRVRAIGLSTLIIHLLGDSCSPAIAGQVSDATGNLRVAMSLYSVTMLAAGAVWLAGWLCMRVCCRGHMLPQPEATTTTTTTVPVGNPATAAALDEEAGEEKEEPVCAPSEECCVRPPQREEGQV
eukprot:TRINITY_DN2958_c0_g1_i4.p2 TRINITY_DN2958_c0_g1~~TRINITY_DN2958_c0_g1_i4.p2  ORF type:complete len:227 (+),score=57.30 TRINITY_DN2958_c0_g1_i4:1016-1696(+)